MTIAEVSDRAGNTNFWTWSTFLVVTILLLIISLAC